jgi:hypothetical protein
MGGADVTNINLNGQIGIDLANRLGLQLPRREGHDLAGPCITCKSSDAFRLHQNTGTGHCYSCGGKWSPFQVAEAVLGDRERAKSVMVEIGLFKANENQVSPFVDPVETIARQKGITVESFRVFGARALSSTDVDLPAYGPDGKPCTIFAISVKGGKGLFAKGKPAGLFFPHADRKVRLPQVGETWHLVEGPKDAAALHGLDLHACGLNTCRLAAKFARLFAGVEIVLVPDRDRAGEEGSQFTARVLRGIAKSVRIAVLPAEFKESEGEDVRDVLRRQGGSEQVLQAIADARPPEGGESDPEEDPPSPPTASAEIALPEGDPLKLEVHPAGKEPQRVVVAIRGDVEHRDRINTDSSVSRDRFVKKLATKIGVDRDVLFPHIDSQLTKLADEIDSKNPMAGGESADEAQSQATLVANMAADWELWHTPGKEGYATIALANHKEVWPIRSQTFKRYIAKQFFDEQGKAISSEALSAAVNLLEAQALFDGQEHTVHVRIAEHEGMIYVDLSNESWQAVEISLQGWRVVDKHPVRFRRSRGMIALPKPEPGGTIDQLRAFLNVDDDAWRLVLAWIVASVRPRGPYPILALVAEQGSGKSTVGRLLRALIDPNAAPLRAEPKDGRDLMIAANNSWCLAFDNLSHVPSWLSDALCRLSTGGGFATRELYTDQDEIIFDSQRPLLVTSIEDVATRSDLLDRCLLVLLPTIPEDRRRPESELMDAFEKVRPQILGAIFDTVAVALKRLPNTKLSSLPRMADFALWATAAEEAFGWATGTFLATYQRNRASVNEVAIDAEVIAEPLLQLLDERGRWEGSASELLKVLEERLGDKVRRMTGWPKNARSLSGHLKRVAPNLRAAGWTMDQDRSSKKRSWVVQRADQHRPPEPSHDPSFGDSGESMSEEAEWRDEFWHDANDADDDRSRQRLPD